MTIISGGVQFGNGVLLSPLVGALYAFTTFDFTTASITGRTGPTLANCQTAYAGQTWLSSYFSMPTQGYQRWTVPQTGDYIIRVAGSRAGRVTGQVYTSGTGAIVSGTVSLAAGDILEIICGQYLDSTNTGSVGGYYGLGGGGGSFVKNVTTSALLMAAGGGGGASFYNSGGTPTGYNGGNGLTTTAGGNGGVAGSNVGGTAGSGGAIYITQTHIYKGGAGGGWLGNGRNGDNTAYPTVPSGTTYGYGGYGYAGGFLGGLHGNSWSLPSTYASTYGGFGGGGGGNGIIVGGAGGGYSGGGISGVSTNAYVSGTGGGGSYIISTATNVSTSDGNYDGSATFNSAAITNLAAYNASSGYVRITRI